MALTLVKITIPAGQSLSNAASLTAGRLVRIRTPAQWKSANVTFQCASADVAADYRDVYDRIGNEIMLNTVKPVTVIGLPAEVTAFLQDAWLKIRSGPSARPMVQPAACEFELVLYKGPSTTATALRSEDDEA